MKKKEYQQFLNDMIEMYGALSEAVKSLNLRARNQFGDKKYRKYKEEVLNARKMGKEWIVSAN